MKMNVKIQDKAFEVEVGDIHARPIQVNVDGEDFEVWPEGSSRPVSTPIPAAPQPAMAAAPLNAALKAASSNAVIAPIPGVIIEIKVNEGESVTRGQELCILEAMKMKNSIRAGHDGIINKIYISTGTQVQQGILLMDFREKAG